MITSKNFVQKYWTGIEAQVIQMAAARKRDYIIWLRIDETPVDGISEHTYSLKWNDNPEEIAVIIEEIIRKHKKKILYKWAAVIIPIAAISITSVLLLGYKENINQAGVNVLNFNNGDTSKLKPVDSQSKKIFIPHNPEIIKGSRKRKEREPPPAEQISVTIIKN
jgi:hypothetical protein